MVELNFDSTSLKGRNAGVSSDGTYNPARATAELVIAHLPEHCYTAEYDDLPGRAAVRFEPTGSASFEVKPATEGRRLVRSHRLTMSIAELEDAVQQLDTRLAELAADRAAQAEAEAAYTTKRIGELEAALTALRTALKPLAGDQWRAFAALHVEFKRTTDAVEGELAELRTRKPTRVSAGPLSELRRLLAAELKRLVEERTAADKEAVDRLRRLGYGI